MFEFLSRGNDGDSGKMDRKTITTEHANIRTVESQGVLTQEAELEKEPESNGDTVELAKFREDKSLLSDNHPDTINITEAQARESSLFTDEEVEELSRADSGLSEEEKESIRKVEAALDDPSMPDSRTELWYLARDKEGCVPDTPDDPQERIRDELSDRPWVEESPSEKPISELSAGAFKELIQEATGESDTQEELAEPTEIEEESEVDIVRIDEETAELAAESFEERKKEYWQDTADDLRKSNEIPDTQVETLSDGSKLITTSLDKLCNELRVMHNNDSKATRVKDKSGDVITAIVPKGEKYQ